jgi:membrane protein YdbS with pleckstrin-like domain
MEPIVLKPENEQKTLWIIDWAIPFVIGLIVWTIMALFVERVVFGLCLAGWLIVMLLILLWIPAFYKSLEYVINSDSVKAKAGVFWRKNVTIPYTKVTNLDITQGPLERMFDIGTIHVQTAGAGGQEGTKAELKLVGMRELDGLKDTIMEQIRDHMFAGPDKIKEAASHEEDSQIFECILKELKAIRQVLENK